MPLQKLQFRPGVNREGTTLANEGGWFDGDKIRFRSGYPEKIGGWAALSFNTFLGVCRSLWGWITLKGYDLLGVGTNLKFYIENGGVYYDITPLREINGNTPSAGPPVVIGSVITLTASGTVLTVSDSGADRLQANDFVTIAGAGTIGGVDVNGEYQITSVLSGTSYTVTLPTPTTGSNAAATITIAYQINTGFPIYTEGTGWSTGPWAPYATATLVDPFATTNGSSTITVTQASHGLSNGQYVYFASISDTDVSGISNTVLQKAFQVTVVNATTYTISAVIGQAPGPVFTYTANATSSTQGGNVTVYYPSAAITASATRGWGTGFTTGIGQQLRLWSQANFGERLLFSPRGGALYVWLPGAGTTPALTTRGELVSGPNVPSTINQIMVSDSARIVIAFGCNDYGAYDTTPLDPMLIRWTAQESYTDWTFDPLGLTQAGFFRLSHGSRIVSALQTRQEIVVFTDSSVYSMQYLGLPAVWGFTLLADNTSIISPNAVATAAGVVYWMGVDKFYVYAGRVETLPCSVRQYVFSSINRNQGAQFFAGTNEGYSEIWWYYCSIEGADGTGTAENPNTLIDRYVIFNHLDRVWYYGKLGRTAWLDSPLRPFPQAATYTNLVVLHEAAVDDASTPEPVPIEAYVQSSDFDIGDGHNYGFVWQIIPDISFDGSDNLTVDSERPKVTLTIQPRQNPGSAYGLAASPQVQSKENYAIGQSYTVQEFTQLVYTRLRGRQMAFKIESNTLGTQWQLGVPRMDVRPDGRK
jgi:hypothetical protein